MWVLGIEHCVRATGTPNHGAISPGFLKEWVCMCFCECGNVRAHAYVVYMCIYLCVCECIHWYACEHVGPLAHLYLWRPETDISCLPLLLSILSLVFDDFLHKAGAYWFSLLADHWQLAPSIWLSALSLGLGIKLCIAAADFILGIWIHVFIFALSSQSQEWILRGVKS